MRVGYEQANQLKRKSVPGTAYRLQGGSHAAESHSYRITHAECKWQTISVYVYATCSQPLHIPTPRPALRRGLGRLPQGGGLGLSLRCSFKKIPKPPGPVHVPIFLLLLLLMVCFVLFVYVSKF